MEKIGRNAKIEHRVIDGHTYVILDAPYLDCGYASEWRYTSGTCRCDACTDKHTELARKRNNGWRALEQRREAAKAAKRQRLATPEDVWDLPGEVRGDAR